MAKLGLVENGVKRRGKKRRRRNPTATTPRAKNPAKRRAISVASAKAVLKRNDLKVVSKSVANPKRKRHHKRRNGISTAAITRRNGILGNTKGDAKTVGAVLGGAIFTKTVGRLLSGYVAPYLSQLGIGKYSEIVVDGAVALLITPFVASKVVKGGDIAKQARLGGLLVVGLSAIEAIAPSVLQYNPFVTSPVVMTGGGAAITPAAVAQIAAGVANSSDPAQAAAKVGNAMMSLDAGGAQYAGVQNSYAGPAPELVL